MILKNLSALACITVIGIGAAQATNVVVDMSQVVDYTVYQTDLQQCEGLAVQNQPSAPQREAVAGTAVKGAAVGAAADAVSGGLASRQFDGLVNLRRVPSSSGFLPPVPTFGLMLKVSISCFI